MESTTSYPFPVQTVCMYDRQTDRQIYVCMDVCMYVRMNVACVRMYECCVCMNVACVRAYVCMNVLNVRQGGILSPFLSLLLI